jgi:hypothetical protein
VVLRLSKEVVRQVAPGEVPLFTVVADAHRDGRRLMRRSERDVALGFGVGEVVTLVTPLVLDLVSRIWEHLLEDLAESGCDLVRDLLAGLRARFGEGDGAPCAPKFTPEQLDYLRRAGERALATLGEPSGRPAVSPALLLDAVIGAAAVPRGER